MMASPSEFPCARAIARAGRFLIVGLGNPGPEYDGNRHNLGKRCLVQLADAHHIKIDSRRFRAAYGLGAIEGRSVALAYPRTYMNHSGVAVAGLARFYKVPLHNLLVIYDDLDLALGVVRMRPGGGSGGHKGMKSVIQHLGAKMDFPRLRIGIGRPPDQMDPAAYVLQDFSCAEKESVAAAIGRAVEAVRLWLRLGIEAAMNEVN
jgi:PTH1 family peptidyl-tRNA hydrolase